MRLAILVLGVGALLLPAVGHAVEPATPTPTPDSEFLEYLGSGDDGDPELQHYLVKRDDPRPDDAKPTPKRGDGKT